MVAIPGALARLPLACPLDGLALAPGPHGLACPAGHNHDVSARGYADLLPVARRPSRAPGDDRTMVLARRTVLERGLFAPVADAAVGAALDAARGLDAAPGALVDAGCGEGWYTVRLARAFADASDGAFARASGDDPAAAVPTLGCDISRAAVRAAARRTATPRPGDPGWAVANNARLPVLPGSAGLITSLFGFETWSAWAALQRPGQVVVTAHAGANHLVELRRIVYDEVRAREPGFAPAAAAAGYEIAAERRARCEAGVAEPGLARAVLAMTPHAHRVGAARRASPDLDARLDALGALSLDVVVRTWRLRR